MQDLAARMCSRHRGELPRSVESDGFVPQRSEVGKITAGSATEIKDAVGRVTLYSIEECRVILADIVVSRTVPERLGRTDRKTRSSSRRGGGPLPHHVVFGCCSSEPSACLKKLFVSYPPSVERLETCWRDRPLRG